MPEPQGPNILLPRLEQTKFEGWKKGRRLIGERTWQQKGYEEWARPISLRKDKRGKGTQRGDQNLEPSGLIHIHR